MKTLNIVLLLIVSSCSFSLSPKATVLTPQEFDKIEIDEPTQLVNTGTWVRHLTITTREGNGLVKTKVTVFSADPEFLEITSEDQEPRFGLNDNTYRSA